MRFVEFKTSTSNGFAGQQFLRKCFINPAFVVCVEDAGLWMTDDAPVPATRVQMVDYTVYVIRDASSVMIELGR